VELDDSEENQSAEEGRLDRHIFSDLVARPIEVITRGSFAETN
jgi:hypothetical protein